MLVVQAGQVADNPCLHALLQSSGSQEPQASLRLTLGFSSTNTYTVYHHLLSFKQGLSTAMQVCQA